MTQHLEEPNSCEQLLARMVGFNTIFATQSGRDQPELKLAEDLQQLARTWGFKTELLPVPDHAPNLLIRHEVDAAAPWLVFDSHLDTVDVAGMTIDPFAAEIRDGKMYGRGASDTKGTGAAMLWALRSVAAKSAASINLAILFTVDEENTQIGARTFANKQLEQLDFRPVGMIVGEPTWMRLVTAANGVVRWGVETRGVPAHSCAPQLGRSAISDMARVIETIEQRYIPAIEASHPLTGKAGCSINLIEGGLQINIIPPHCRIQIDRRLVPGEDPLAVLPAVEAVLEPLRQKDPDLTVEQDEPRIVPALDPQVGKSFAGTAAVVLERSGFDPQVAGVPYATNGNSFCQAGLPTIVLGPGDIAQAHTRNEWLDLEQLHQGIVGYRSLMSEPEQTWA